MITQVTYVKLSAKGRYVKHESALLSLEELSAALPYDSQAVAAAMIYSGHVKLVLYTDCAGMKIKRVYTWK